jgi:hypothetical protein
MGMPVVFTLQAKDSKIDPPLPYPHIRSIRDTYVGWSLIFTCALLSSLLIMRGPPLSPAHASWLPFSNLPSRYRYESGVLQKSYTGVTQAQAAISNLFQGSCSLYPHITGTYLCATGQYKFFLNKIQYLTVLP